MINGSYWLGAAAGALLAGACSTRPCSPPTSAGGSPSASAPSLGLGDPARPPPRAREPALALHPRPRARRPSGSSAKSRRRSRRRPARSSRSRRSASRSASASGSRSARSRGPRSSLPATHDPRALAVRRPGVPLQRRHLRPRDAARRILRSRLGDDPSLHRRVRLSQLPRAADPRALLRHRRPQTDGHRHLSRLGGGHRVARRDPPRRRTHHLVVHGAHPGRPSSSPRRAPAPPT